MTDAGEKIGLYFTPANEGDFLAGLPARDLTEAEVARYAEREPALLRDATTPHPATGKALYSATAPSGKRAAGVTTTAAPARPAEDGD